MIEKRLFNGCLFLKCFVMEEVLYQHTLSLNKAVVEAVVVESKRINVIPMVLCFVPIALFIQNFPLIPGSLD